MKQLKQAVLTRVYDLGTEDPIEVAADYETGFDGGVLSKSHENCTPGVTLTVHGSGSLWLSWEDLPILIEGLQQVLRENPSIKPWKEP